jgi:small subunit ribosomal protein S13
MPRIAGVNIPDNKKIGVAITYIYGVGTALSKKIIAGTNLDSKKLAKDLTQAEINLLREYIEKNFRIEGD